MGLATIDLHSLKEHTKIYAAGPEGHTFLCKILKFSNGCILLIIGSVYTKLRDFVNLGVLF